jgi:hypothetical protein
MQSDGKEAAAPQQTRSAMAPVDLVVGGIWAQPRLDTTKVANDADAPNRRLYVLSQPQLESLLELTRHRVQRLSDLYDRFGELLSSSLPKTPGRHERLERRRGCVAAEIRRQTQVFCSLSEQRHQASRVTGLSSPSIETRRPRNRKAANDR